MTPQRLAILKFLEGNTRHPTAEDIFNSIKKVYPTISFATVYNTMDALKKRGEVVELNVDPVRRHYDPETRPHHHIICYKCGKIGDVFEEDMGPVLPPEKISGFSVSSWHIDFSGLCKECG